MIYKISLPDLKHGDLVPQEDSMITDGNIFCVSDGVTRDPISPKDFINKPIESLLKKYPNPSGARWAADIFCKSFVKSLKNKPSSVNNVRNAFISGNNAIAKLNKKYIKSIDYLVDDFFACVASAGVVNKGKLYWGGITDCGIKIYDKNGNVKFQTPNWMEEFELYEKKNLQKSNFNFAKPEYRKLIRSQFRNNSKKIIDNKCVSYGALTGEKGAKHFMNFGEIKLEKGDLIVFYSDGFLDTVKHKNFFKKISKDIEGSTNKGFVSFSMSLAEQDHYKFGRERTLIAVRN